MVKLAGGLDNAVFRIAAQEPRVEKLETDTHCLGMLVSDYEVTFQNIAKHLERHDVKVQEFERTFHRIDKERDALRAEVRTINEQVNYLTTVKADKVDVQTELNRRALVTDMQQRVPYAVFNDTARDLTRMVTQLREELHEVDESLKTVQYELVKGLGAKASAQDVSQIRKQLVEALGRWQKMEKDQQARAVIMGDSPSAAVSAVCGTSTDSSKCLTCGIQTTLEGSHPVVPAKFIPVNRIKHGARNAGGIHTKCVPPEKVFRTGSLGVVKKTTQNEKRTDQQWKFNRPNHATSAWGYSAESNHRKVRSWAKVALDEHVPLRRVMSTFRTALEIFKLSTFRCRKSLFSIMATFRSSILTDPNRLSLLSSRKSPVRPGPSAASGPPGPSAPKPATDADAAACAGAN
uniref:DUF4795 domain-containing protein n=1 Tax=Anopheles culicifacies TaxID=139723 RepID=A0A182MIU8_9DIPT